MALAAQIEEAIVNAHAIKDQAAANSVTGHARDAEQLAIAGQILDALIDMRDGDPCGTGFREHVATMRCSIARHLDAVADETRKRHLEEWTAWIRRGVDSGARNAHRYTRIPQAWRPHAVVTPDGVVSANPAKVIEAYRDKYVRRWNRMAGGGDADEPRRDPPWGRVPRCALPKPSVGDLRQASRAFCADTAVAYDGFAMRHYALLSDAGLAALSDIMIAMEAIGRMPPQLNAVLMPMIGKDRGGYRAITLTTSLYRLWGRVRRPFSQDWEARHDRPFLAAGKGRRVQDVVWRQLLRAEAGSGKGLASAAILWDLASFYDTVNRAKLWRLVRLHDYPLPIARLAMSVYDAPRAIAMEGRLSRPTYARDGVPAGCPFANSFVQLFCIDPFDDFVADVKAEFGDAVTFDAYIDDLVVSICAEEHRVAAIAKQVADMLRSCIEDRMGCQVEISKAAVVASSNKIVVDIARGIGSYAGPPGRRASAVNLGCDFAPGRRRAVQSQSGKRLRRHIIMKRRARKLAKARRALGGGRRTRKIFTTGILAAAVHDAAVNGISDREALVLRRTAATACSPRARGRSLALVTLLSGVPTWRAETEIILQYSRQVWASALQGHRKPENGMLTLSEIADAWRAADKTAIFSGNVQDGADGAALRERRPPQEEGRADVMWDSDGRKRLWNEARGPVSAMLLTLHRIGWSMDSPFTLRDDWGEDIVLTKVSPAMLAQMLREATVRALERYAGRRAAVHDDEFRGRRVCVDHVRSQLASDKSLTYEGKAAFLSVMCNAIMTYNRAALGGYLVEDLCPKCGKRGDTVRHRVWECEHPDVARAREAVAPRWLREEMLRRPASQSRWVTGLVPHPGDVWPRPAADAQPVAEFVGRGDPLRSDEGIPCIGGRAYVDGSCTQNVIGELRRAATSLVAYGDDGDPEWLIKMPVPTPMPQTPQSAEFVALPLAHAYLAAARSELDLASDCANVVRSCLDKGTKAVQGTRVYAGLLKPIISDPAWRRNVRIRKVPAHVQHDGMPDGPEKDDAMGNDIADAQAKLAVDLHPRPLPAVRQGVEADLRRARLIIRTIAATIVHFPPMPKERMQRRPAARDGATILGQGGHRWKFMSGCWRCEVCWALTVKPDIDAALAHRRCAGPKMSMEARNIAARGHRVAYAEGQLPVLFCLACGSYSARRAYGLGAQCPGTASKAGGQALSRIKRGYQPWRTRHDRGQQRPRLLTTAAWSGSRGELVGSRGADGATRRRRNETIDVEGGDTRVPPGKRHCGMTNELCGNERILTRAQVTAHSGINIDTRRACIGLVGGTDLGDAPREYPPEADHMYSQDVNDFDDYDVFGHGGGLDQDVGHAAADDVIETNIVRCKPMGSEPGGRASYREHDRRGLPDSDCHRRRVEEPTSSKWVPRMAGSSTDPPGLGLLGAIEAGNKAGSISGISERNVAKANCIGNDAVDARAGPGAPYPHDAWTTVAAGSSSADELAATVKAECEAALPYPREHTQGTALLLQDYAARGPPSAHAAALGGYRKDTVVNRPDKNSSLKRPISLGARPSTCGRTFWTDDGEPTPGVVRRRDGVDGPASAPVVARGGSDATAGRWGKEPSEGSSNHRVLAARNGCAGSEGDDGNDAGRRLAFDEARDADGCGIDGSPEEEAGALHQRRDELPRRHEHRELLGPRPVQGHHRLCGHHGQELPPLSRAQPLPPRVGDPLPQLPRGRGGRHDGDDDYDANAPAPAQNAPGPGACSVDRAGGCAGTSTPRWLEHSNSVCENEHSGRGGDVASVRSQAASVGDPSASTCGQRLSQGQAAGADAPRETGEPCNADEGPADGAAALCLTAGATGAGAADLGGAVDDGGGHEHRVEVLDAPIRGRRHPPGWDIRADAIGEHAAMRNADIAGVDGAAVPGFGEGAADQPASGGRHRRAAPRPSSSSREAEEYVMRAYLGHHAERVRKRKQSELAEGKPPADTASQRLAALRSRVAIRLSASRHSESGLALRDAVGVAAPPAADAASAAASHVAWHSAVTNTRAS